MRLRSPGIRPVGLVAALATAAAVLAAPAAVADSGQAASGQSGGHGHAVRLTASALHKLSARYTPRSDGTPGLVAEARGDSSKAVSSSGTGGTGGSAASGTSKAATPDASGTKGFTEKGSWETPRGAASTLALGGTRDWVGIFSGGAITRYDADGNPVWQTTSHQLYTDWQVTGKVAYLSQEFSPVLYQGYDPYQPSTIGTHPYAQLDVNHDGTDDIAVAYSVGDSPPRPFTSPGSDLQSGTFVSVLDGKTGAMLWHKLLPGNVGSLTAQDGRLVVADATGPSWDVNPVATQGDSRSSLISYSFSAAAHGAVTGRTAWSYSTKAPWALWSDIEPMGGGRIAAGWTDTPMGLGNPRPADGHVLVLDNRTGKLIDDTKTPGFPRILHKDPASDRVLVAEQNDPLDAVRWDLTSIDPGNGKRSVIASRNGTIPEAFLVNSGAKGDQARYAVAELGINADLSDGQSDIAGLDASGRTLWTHTTASTVGGANAPTLSLTLSGTDKVYAAVADPAQESRTDAEAPDHSQLLAYATDGGTQLWSKAGAVVGDQITPYDGGLLTVGYDQTAYRFDPGRGTAAVLPLLGDVYGATAADVNGDGVKDLVVGGQSRGVFALDGRTLTKPQPKVLWRRTVSAAVRDLTLAPVADRHGRTAQRLVAATSHGFAVLEPRNGTLDADVNTGTFQYKAVVTDGHVLASGTELAAYRADGSKAWSYRPSGTTGKTVAYSTPATADGRVYLEYGGYRTGFSGTSDPAPTAVALNASDGSQVWTEQPTGATAAWIEPQAGAFASPFIPGAGGHGVAFAFGGDKPATGAHLVQTVDGTTGTVLSSDNSTGSPTFRGFAASKKYGLVEFGDSLLTVHPADGGALYRVHTLAEPQQAVFATATDGSETFVAAAGGVLRWTQPFPDDGKYDSSAGQVFALFAGKIVPADLFGGTATDLIAVQFDWAAYNLNENTGGYGWDSLALDSYQHGITVEEATGNTAAQSAQSAKQAQTATSGTTDAAAQPVTTHPLPIGNAIAPMHITRKEAVKAGTSTDAETTVGYTPQQIRTRLGLTGDGSGQTVAITAAYDYANAESDLNHFADHFGLPQTCDSVAKGTDCFDFQQVYASGSKPEADAGWSEEAALDIEWVHSTAPKAKIVLVEAADASAAALYKAIDVADTYHPAAVNNSWGMGEFSEESFYDDHCKLTDSVCTESTGDAGWPANYSSTNPYVLSVGGTHLVLDADGNTQSESAWSATGGGLSFFEKRPAYQDGVQSSAFRAAPDVSFDADPRTGVAVYTTAGGSPQWLEVGGTSLSSPIWAGILSTADQLRSAGGKAPLAVAGTGGDTLHKAVYGLGGALSDVTSGSNGACGAECTAGPGYDTVTGLGSPLAGVDKALAAKE
ncbi:hypothetical protein BIV57_00045 [Mangrovactinospora gilvigrisea]|uniref:Peptidase S53 domain-containing protein n=1 Tax=Mangrovactinospora gilvigrisea TaxID=1428644 RepID=A0A1J7BLR1_9ACTN|nr:hypothetical protein [Mangrovactinospora gilvigrisea]OIV39541.1 hypothetical protein BIV57_00045 [Mangrovactinospora gilvigrisea]